MATYYEEIPSGSVMKCYRCESFIRDAVFYHQCDVRIAATRVAPGYCFSCMAERNVCKRCKDKYTKMFCPMSFRANEEIVRCMREISGPQSKQKTPQLPLIESPTTRTIVKDLPIELLKPLTAQDKARAEFYCLIAEYCSLV